MSASEHAAVYDRISETYDEDFLGLLTQARHVVTHQVGKNINDVETLVDCAIGTGKMVESIEQEVNLGRCIGNDISEQMLRTASTNLKVPFTAICDDALKLGTHVAPNTASLLLCHFLYDYCHPKQMIPLLYETTAPGGYLSSASSTKSGYDEVFWEQIRRHPFLRRIFSVDDNIAQSHTPEDHAHHQELLTDAGFEVVEEQTLSALIVMESADDLWNAVYHSGWFAGYLGQFSPATLRAIRGLASLLALPGVNLYPLRFNARLSVCLAKKPA